jgi:hypothetical protein
MIVRIGMHEVALSPNALDDALLVGEVDGFTVEVAPWRSPARPDRRWEAYVGHGDFTLGRAYGESIQEAVSAAFDEAILQAARHANAAKRKYEQLDVYRLNVIARMQETAGVAERMREIRDGSRALSGGVDG